MKKLILVVFTIFTVHILSAQQSQRFIAFIGYENDDPVFMDLTKSIEGESFTLSRYDKKNGMTNLPVDVSNYLLPVAYDNGHLIAVNKEMKLVLNKSNEEKILVLSDNAQLQNELNMNSAVMRFKMGLQVISFTPDGSRLYFPLKTKSGEPNTLLYEYDLASGALKNTEISDHLLTAPVLIDNMFYYFNQSEKSNISGYDINVYNTDTKETDKLPFRINKMADRVSIAPNGKTILYLQDNTLYAYSVERKLFQEVPIKDSPMMESKSLSDAFLSIYYDKKSEEWKYLAMENDNFEGIRLPINYKETAFTLDLQ